MSAQAASQLHPQLYAATQLSNRSDPEFTKFLRQFFLHAVPQDLELFTAEALEEIAHFVWEATQRRAKGQRLIVIEPTPVGHGSLVLAVNDDMPFLYDSAMEDLAAHSISVRAAFHPIVTVRRDAKGVRLGLGNGSTDGIVRESYILTLFDEPVERLRELGVEGRLNDVFDDVKVTVRDWKPILAKLEESIQELTEHPPAEASQEDISESLAFLKWLGHNNFTFLGCRDYVFTHEGEGEFHPVQASGLGLLSDPERRIIRRTGRAELTPEVRDFLMQPSPLIITKAAERSTVHRRVHQDYIGVKRFDANGKLAGERRFVGLFTSSAYQKPALEIPLLRRKLQHVLYRSEFPEGGHAYKGLVNVLETFPRDELFQIADSEDLYDIALGILHIIERPQTQLFVRLDKFDRFVSALVFVPRERFSTEVIDRAAKILADAYDGRVSAVYPQFGDTAVARAHIIIGRNTGPRPDPDLTALRQAIVRASRTWDENLAEVLTALRDRNLPALLTKYAGAFDGAYQYATTPEDAAIDISHIEQLIADGAQPGQIVVDTYRLPGDPVNALRAKLFMAHGPAELSACLPVFENFGLKVLEERPYRVTPQVGTERVPITIQDFRMELVRPQPLDLTVVKALFEEAFRGVWSAATENDGFNRLILSAAMPSRDVVVVRAIAKFLRQTGIAFSQAYMEEALARNADIAGLIVQLFRARFDPSLANDVRVKQVETIGKRVDGALADVRSLDDDRILRRFRNAVTAMLRTTFFQTDANGAARSVLAFKFASHELEELPLPRPLFEIFVYSPRVEGVHLRFGKVARGGLRWSDRREDFRTEVLSLVKAQQVKNAVIVPVGAKGGFYPKQLPVAGTREQVQEEGIASYKLFISALLDLTDNIVGSKIVPPENTVRHDEDDPYLVVAADKGTATFSDIANGLAVARGFWMGDAFASGGSNGYDHKKMGITAKGAWEAVKRHFYEMGRDTQTQDFTVVGIGDMSGDVFGNGMLLSPHIRLVAAFDHRDIFIDPTPDVAKSFAERKRMFDLPRSSWADYNKALISKGGGVFSRSVKSIPLSAEMKALSGLTADAASPPELMKALLKAEVDLLWFGGIGTFIKATSQSHADAGDRTNDAIRVNATEVRAKVVGEGANLGVTQSGRIELARTGGRINTDAIDNSAGVDTSDHEVNLKILLNGAVTDKAMTVQQRDKLLPELTDEIAQHVLKDNYDQTLALSIAQATAPSDLDDHMRMIRDLERRGRLDRTVEGLPSDDDARELAQDGKGLTRPELAVLLAYAKLTLFEEILASNVPDDPTMEDLATGYFPPAVSAKLAPYIAQHRLKREIIATVLVNMLVNAGGPVFVHRIRESSGADAPSIARSYAVASRAYRLDELRDKINALDGKVPAEVQISMHRDVIELLQRETTWVLRTISPTQPLSEVVPLYRNGIDSLRGTFSTLVSPVEAQLVETRIQELQAANVPMDVAEEVAVAPVVTAVTDIVRIASETNLPIDAVAGAFFAAGEAAGIDRLRAAAARIVLPSHWDRLALQRIADDLFSCQRALASKALAHIDRASPTLTRENGDQAVNRWAATSQGPLDQARALIGDLERTGPFNIAKLTLAVGQLRDLAGV